MAKIILETIDSFNENITQKMIAKKNINSDNTEFIYNNKYGHGKFTIYKDLVTIERYGNDNHILKLIPGEYTDFVYRYQNQNFNFKVFCHSLESSNNSFKAKYTLYQNSNEFNTIEVKVLEIL